jgi:hypothetical protein
VKKVILIVVVMLVVVGGAIWFKKHGNAGGDAAKPADKAADAGDEEAGTKVSRDDKGNVIITMSDDAQGDYGINVTKVEAAQFDRELKAYGHVLDPGPLAALLTELATSKAAYIASSNELARLKTLATEGNASARALQTGEAAALHDQLAVQSAKDRLSLGWGKAITELADPSALLALLVAQEKALVVVDLPGGEVGPPAPAGARLVALAGDTVSGRFFGTATSVDPQAQGRGYIFLIESNTTAFAPGEAVTGFIKTGGEPLAGVIVPNAAIIRTEGSGWAYVLQGNAEDFKRVAVALDRPVDNGWFVTNGVTASNYVVTTGAQMLLSEELKGAARPPD